MNNSKVQQLFMIQSFKSSISNSIFISLCTIKNNYLFVIELFKNSTVNGIFDQISISLCTIKNNY
jgi:hypothetical protein